MKRILLVVLTALACGPWAAAVTRHYYIAAEDVTWDYAPSGRDLFHSRPVPMPWGGQTKWTKARYIEYTDATFSTKKPQPEWLGILGPVIRAEVGDEIVVDFFNKARMPHSIHTHGVRYDKDNEGSMYLPLGKGSQVAPGHHYVYHWTADAKSGPGPGQLSSIVWWYHGGVEEPREINAGLQGPLIITAKGKARPDGGPKDVDREFVASFQIFDEMMMKPAGMFHAVNGYIFGNLPGLVMKQGERVRWYLLGMGNEKDLHSAHWHGKTVEDGMKHTDVVELLPGSMATVDMLADNPGTWMFHCHVADHMESGMMASYTIYAPSTRACPVKIHGGDFWNADKFSVEVENASKKNIKSMTLMSDHMLGPGYRHRPFSKAEWKLDEPLPSGAKKLIERAAYPPEQRKQVAGWVFYPASITYEDGTVWKPENEGECFEVVWRDAEHPEMSVLPALQIDLNDD